MSRTSISYGLPAAAFLLIVAGGAMVLLGEEGSEDRLVQNAVEFMDERDPAPPGPGHGLGASDSGSETVWSDEPAGTDSDPLYYSNDELIVDSSGLEPSPMNDGSPMIDLGDDPESEDMADDAPYSDAEGDSDT